MSPARGVGCAASTHVVAGAALLLLAGVLARDTAAASSTHPAVRAHAANGEIAVAGHAPLALLAARFGADVTPPVISACAPDASVAADGSCGAIVPDMTGGVVATDDSGTVTITQAPTAGSAAGPGVTVITFTAADPSGNTATCSANFAVLDQTPPTIQTCAADVDVDADATCAGTIPDLAGSVVATDACGAVTISQSPAAGSPAALGVTVVTLTATDGAGLFATCAANVTVLDRTPPTIQTCAADVDVDADATCAGTIPDLAGSVVATDACGAVTISQSPAAGTPAALGTTVVTLTATDGAGLFATCAANVTVADRTPPTILTCAADVAISTGSACSTALVDLTGLVVAADNCGPVTVTQVPAAGSTVGLGVVVVELTATDEAGLTAQCSASVTVTGTDGDGDGIADCEDPCPSDPIASEVRLNELYFQHASADVREFIELRGPPGASLGCHVLLIVDGDGVNAGVLDRAFDLSAYAIAADGLFVLGDSAMPERDYDLGARDRLENGSATVYLVTTSRAADLVGLVGTRVATGAGTTAIPSLGTVLDSVALVDADYPVLDVAYDAAPVVGPDDEFLPAGIARCGNAPGGWNPEELPYDPLATAPMAVTAGDANAACDPGFGYCFGDGSSTPCPCGNESPVGAGAGCLNSLASGAALRATGTASLSDDTAVLRAEGMPSEGTALYFQGTERLDGGAGVPFGDGVRCVSGAVLRLGIHTSVAGGSQFPWGADPPISVRGSIGAPSTRHYQVWYRNVGEYCTSAPFNLSNGWTITWVP